MLAVMALTHEFQLIFMSYLRTPKTEELANGDLSLSFIVGWPTEKNVGTEDVKYEVITIPLNA